MSIVAESPASSPSRDGIAVVPGVFIPIGALRWQFARGSGPGGQNVNKVNTRAEVWIKIDEIVGLTSGAAERLRQFAGKRLTRLDELHISGEEHRSQETNRRAVLERAVMLIRRSVKEPKVRKRTRPTKAARRRRLESKRLRAQVKSLRRPDAE